MGLFRRFEVFDPISGDLPYMLFGDTHDIAWRARSLLHGRTGSQVIRLAMDSRYVVEKFFELARENAIERMEYEGDPDYCELTTDEDGITTCSINPEKVCNLDFPNEDNTTDIEALKQSLESWEDLSGEDVPDAKNYEYYAATALWYISIIIEQIKYQFDVTSWKLVKRENSEFNNDDYIYCGQYAIKAMEAVCYGEHMLEMENIQNHIEERMAIFQQSQQKEIEEGYQTIRNELAAQHHEKEARRKSERGKHLSRLRHQPRDEAKQSVLSEWEKNPSAFSSAEKAGNHYSDWLHPRVPLNLRHCKLKYLLLNCPFTV